MYIVKDLNGYYLAVAHIGNKFNFPVQSPYWVTKKEQAEYFYLKREAKDYCIRNKISNKNIIKV